ncbi:uncharacterized protein AC631_00468 [Debaryomyces fabryi]|uniref:Uncharacterized protein n=1 Tax=Debaryomyces fabryi TaxID=58627 RepID=A0A0V1Q5V5_9ASCO|nr:uncharacterized protein AC631_00468 [Debaryomyces fabryi]KSA03833.1 hypothetical protein AC631_00468 [Debaryomyces fabryi]CUM45353.1 unnamed protein product [Debaryomyces fabryi]
MSVPLMTNEVPEYSEHSNTEKSPRYTAPSEPLPQYEPSLEYYGLSLIKTEFSSPYHYNTGNRSWKPVLLEINSTQLNIYDLKVEKKVLELIVALYNDSNHLNDVMQIIQNEKMTNEGDDDLDEMWNDAYQGEVDDLKQSTSSKWKSLWHKSKYNKVLNKGISQYYELIKDNRMLFEPTKSSSEYNIFRSKFQGIQIASYTLNNLYVGEAPSLNHLISSMYKEDKSHINKHNISTLVKYKNTLRVRIELKQMLLQFWSFYGMVHWFRALSIAKDLSSALEDRTVTKLKSIPSRNSRNDNLLAATEAAAMLGAASEDGGDVTYFTNPFSSQSPKHIILGNSDRDDSAQLSIVSLGSNTPNSVFSNERRESVGSTASDIYSSSTVPNNRYNKNVNKFSLVSYDKVFATTVEKQYISNCIPDLNSFDKWCGLDVTITNYKQYLSPSQLDASSKDIFISSSALDNTSWGFSKVLKKSHQQSNYSKSFVIDQKGLVSLAH